MKLSPILFALMLGGSTAGIAQTTTPISRPLPPSSTQSSKQVAKLVIPAAPYVPSFNDINSQVQIAITNGTVVVPTATKVAGTFATGYYFYRVYPYGTAVYFEHRFTCVWGMGDSGYSLPLSFGGDNPITPGHTKPICPAGSGAYDITVVGGMDDAHGS